MKLKSKKKPPKPDVWISEIVVKDKNFTPQIKRLIALVRKYEDIS